jgi:hypothetical protein
MLRILLIALFIVFAINSSYAADDFVKPSGEDSKNPLFYSIGIGFGPAYSGVGARATLGYEYVSADLGAGMGPSVIAGLTGYFTERTSNVKPKLSCYYMNFATVARPDGAKLGEGDLYPGVCALGGIDFRLGDSSMFYADGGIGYAYTFKKWDDIKADYQKNHPDEIRELKKPSPFRFYVGFGLNFGRD